jgi:hypothetical protein
MKEIDKIDFNTIITNKQKLMILMPTLIIDIDFMNRLKLFIAKKILNILETIKNNEKFLIFFEKSNYLNNNKYNDKHLLNEIINTYHTMINLDNNYELIFSLEKEELIKNYSKEEKNDIIYLKVNSQLNY